MLGENFRNAGTPEFIQVFTTTILKWQAHLEAVGLHQIQRAQQPIETRQNAQMLLGKGQFSCTQGLGRQPRVDVAFEGQYGLLGILQGEIGLPIHKPLVIQRRNIRRNPHQSLNILRAHGLCLADQRRHLINK